MLEGASGVPDTAEGQALKDGISSRFLSRVVPAELIRALL